MHKLTVNIMEDVLDPLGRKYTLTHCDETGMRFLFIGSEYAEEAYDELRDEVVAHWEKLDDIYFLKVFCPLSCAKSKYSTDERLQIFRRHMPRVLKAIIGGDLHYINSTQGLLDAANHIYYCYDEDHEVFENMGIVKEYLKKPLLESSRG